MCPLQFTSEEKGKKGEKHVIILCRETNKQIKSPTKSHA